MRTQAAFWQWKLAHQRCWQTLSDDVTGSVVGITAAERDFVTQEFRHDALFENTTVRDAHGSPNQASIETLMDDGTAAQAEADRAGALTSEDRDDYVLNVIGHQWLIREGDTVTVADDVTEFGHDIEPGDYLVLGLGESTTAGRTPLQMWG